jgi:hypothetical protein
VEAQEVIAGEDLAEQRSGAGQLPGVGPEPLQGLAEGSRVGCIEAQAPSCGSPGAGSAKLGEGHGGVVPGRDGSGPGRLVPHGDQVKPPVAPRAAPRPEVQAGLLDRSGPRVSEPFPRLDVGPGEPSAEGQDVQSSARRGARLGIEPEDRNPRAQCRSRSSRHRALASFRRRSFRKMMSPTGPIVPFPVGFPARATRKQPPCLDRRGSPVRVPKRIIHANRATHRRRPAVPRGPRPRALARPAARAPAGSPAPAPRRGRGAS